MIVGSAVSMNRVEKSLIIIRDVVDEIALDLEVPGVDGERRENFGRPLRFKGAHRINRRRIEEVVDALVRPRQQGVIGPRGLRAEQYGLEKGGGRSDVGATQIHGFIDWFGAAACFLLEK